MRPSRDQAQPWPTDPVISQGRDQYGSMEPPAQILVETIHLANSYCSKPVLGAKKDLSRDLATHPHIHLHVHLHLYPNPRSRPHCQSHSHSHPHHLYSPRPHLHHQIGGENKDSPRPRRRVDRTLETIPRGGSVIPDPPSGLLPSKTFSFEIRCCVC